MFKRIALTLLLLLAFSVNLAFAAEAPTQKEWSIYYDYVEKVNGVDANSGPAFEAALKQVAESHAITMDELGAIEMKVMKYGLTPEEQKIRDEISREAEKDGEDNYYRNLPQAVSNAAAKYGISQARAQELYDRAELNALTGGDLEGI